MSCKAKTMIEQDSTESRFNGRPSVRPVDWILKQNVANQAPSSPLAMIAEALLIRLHVASSITAHVSSFSFSAFNSLRYVGSSIRPAVCSCRNVVANRSRRFLDCNLNSIAAQTERPNKLRPIEKHFLIWLRRGHTTPNFSNPLDSALMFAL